MQEARTAFGYGESIVSVNALMDVNARLADGTHGLETAVSAPPRY